MDSENSERMRRHFKRELVGRIAGREAYLRPDEDSDGFNNGRLALEEKDDRRYVIVKIGTRAELLALLDPADAPVPPPAPKRILTEKDLRRRLEKLDEAKEIDAQVAALQARAAKIRAEALS